MDVTLSVPDVLKIIFVIIVTKLLNFVILKKMTSMLRILIFYLGYWSIERTSFYLLEKVTFLSQLLLMPTVSFYGINNYDDSILGKFNQQHLRNYAYSPSSMIPMLIHLHRQSVTEKAIELLGGLLTTYLLSISVRKLTKNAAECLDSSNLELQKAIVSTASIKDDNIIALLKHLFKSIQEVNSANNYLLESSRELEIQDRGMNCLPQEIIESLLVPYRRVIDAIITLTHSGQPDYDGEERIENKHVMSLVIVDDMAQDVAAGCVTRPPIDIISSRYENKPYEKTINEVKKAMLCNSDGYKCPSDEERVRELRAVDCTNIHQMYGIDVWSIPPKIASWSNLVWFQCPWIEKNERDAEWAIADLLDFLGNAAKNCAPDTFVCVGITTHPRYMHQYCLERILGACTLDQYEFLGVDDVLINKLLSYGYKHESIKPPKNKIHGYIKGCHVTLVFRVTSVHVLHYAMNTNGNITFFP